MNSKEKQNSEEIVLLTPLQAIEAMKDALNELSGEDSPLKKEIIKRASKYSEPRSGGM